MEESPEMAASLSTPNVGLLCVGCYDDLLGNALLISQIRCPAPMEIVTASRKCRIHRYVFSGIG